MLFSKSYVRKTKKGSVIKIVKEHYLRDDLYCGIPFCDYCEPHKSNLEDVAEFIIPDTNILYHQIDVMEHKAIENVIILQTVLEELKNRSTPVYQRVRAMISEPSRKYYVFCNEHHRETFVHKIENESSNDRNDRAIRRAVEWYKAHSDKSFKLITNDAENRRKANAEGLIAISIRGFVESLVKFPELTDLVVAYDEDKSDVANQFQYAEHLSRVQISAGLKSGAFYQGCLSISSYNFLEVNSKFNIGNNDNQSQ
jgi:exosome complex exonuclease DIS3/RRP44